MKVSKSGLLMASLLFGLVVVTAMGVWTVQSLRDTSGHLSGRVDSVMVLVRQERWGDAEQALTDLDGDWQKVRKWWTVFLHHREIDNIDFSIARIREYLWAEDEELALGEAAALREMIMHIPDKESLTLENVL